MDEIEKINTTKDEVYLEPATQTQAFNLTDQQLDVVKLAHQDPLKFVNEVSEKIVSSVTEEADKEKLKLSADIISRDFALKLLELNPEEKEVFVDHQPVDVFTAFANPEDPTLKEVVENPEDRKLIAGTIQNAAYAYERESTIAANAVESAIGPGWSRFYIPDKVTSAKISTEKTKTSSAVVNMRSFLNELSSYKTTEKTIWDKLKAENPEVFSQLSKRELTELRKEVKEAAQKAVSASVAFEFLTGRRGYLPEAEVPQVKHKSDWLRLHMANAGVPDLTYTVQGFSTAMFDDLESAYSVTSPAFKMAFNKFVTKIPAVAKVNQVISGLEARITKAIVNQIVTKVIPAVTSGVGTGAAAGAGAGAAAGAATGAAAGAGAGAAAGAATGAEAGAAVGAVAGAPTGPFAILIAAITAAIGAIVGWLSTKIKKFIKEHPEVFGLMIAGPLFVFGLIAGSPFLVMGSLATGLGSLAFKAGAKSITTGALGLMKRFIFGITRLLFPILIWPFIVAFLVLVFVIAAVYFIISTGAYLVPPKTNISSGPGTIIASPYIDVIKTPNPAGPFQNGDLPLTIQYTVQIIAKQGSLTNISISYKCSVSSSKGTTNCPSTNPAIPSGLTIPSSITPQTPFSFTYEQIFISPDYEDSIITDVITVQADVGGTSAQAAGSATIVIGNPPDECPQGWPVGPEGSETYLVITQGPHAGTHSPSLEAIDVGTTSGHTTKATHSGTAFVYYTSGAYRPAYVDVHSICEGKKFFSRHAHLSAVHVSDGQQVTMSQPLGLTGTNGTGPHLHYEFNGLKMAPPYIPKAVSYGCPSNCGTIP